MLFLVSEFVIKCGEIFVECILFILFLFNCNKTFSEYAFIEQPTASIKVMVRAVMVRNPTLASNVALCSSGSHASWLSV